MTYIISMMLLWGLFPDVAFQDKTGLSFILFIVWLFRVAIKGAIKND